MNARLKRCTEGTVDEDALWQIHTHDCMSAYIKGIKFLSDKLSLSPSIWLYVLIFPGGNVIRCAPSRYRGRQWEEAQAGCETEEDICVRRKGVYSSAYVCVCLLVKSACHACNGKTLIGFQVVTLCEPLDLLLLKVLYSRHTRTHTLTPSAALWACVSARYAHAPRQLSPVP